jgi:two-component system, NtrC family, sensor histidine kinase HydH
MWKKIIGPTLLVSLLWIVLESLTYSYDRKLNAAHEQMFQEHLTITRAANEMQASLAKLQSIALSAEDQSGEYLLTEALRCRAGFEQALTSANQATVSSRERSLIQSIWHEFNLYSDGIGLWLNTRDTKIAFGVHPGSADLVARVQAISSATKQLIEIDQERLERSTDQYPRLSRLINYVRLVFFIGGPAIGILLGVRVAQGLRGSIRKLSSQLKDATKGLNREQGEESAPSSELPALENQVHEVSDQVGRLVQELDEARQFSARSERLAAVGVLAAGVAHELRNPLTSVKLLVQTAALKFPSRPLSDRQLQILQDEIARMEQSIQSLLDFACMPRPRCVTHDLRDTIERAIKLVRPRAGQLRIQVSYELPDSPAWIHSDPAQLHLVFANLLLNGMESMPAGGTLCVTIHMDRSLPATYGIEISDTGAGIPCELMDRLFEPFVTGKEHGCGLGLSICRRIVREHGGTISAANRPEGGAVFRVELPSSVSDPVTQHAHEAQEFDHVQAASH